LKNLQLYKTDLPIFYKKKDFSCKFFIDLYLKTDQFQKK